MPGDEPFDGGGKGVGAGLVVQFDSNADQGPALGGKVGAQVLQTIPWCQNGGGDRALSGLAEFGVEAAHDRNDAGRGAAKGPEQKLTAGGFRERQLGTGVNGAKMVEILRSGWKPQDLWWSGRGLNTKKAVEGEFGDAVFHEMGSRCMTPLRFS